jgi:HlyD family secretion protein
MSKIINFIKEFCVNIYQNHLKKIVFIIAVIIFGIFYFQTNTTKTEIGKLETGTIEETVSVSGTVTPSEESSLSFQKAGRIESINVKTGNIVKKGQSLANLSNSSDYASVLSAKASLAQAEANLADIENGPSDSDLRLKEDSVKSAKYNLYNANNTVSDTLRSVNNSLTDILQNKLGNFFTNNSGTYKLNYNTCDQNLTSNVEIQRLSVNKNITDVNNLVLNFTLTSDDNVNNENIDNAGNVASLAAKKVSNLLDDLNTLFTSSCAINDAALDSKRNTISTTRTNISSTLSTINTAKSEILTYRNALSSANLSLNQLKAGATDQKIKSLKAQVDGAKAAVLLAEANNGNNFLTAPFDGIITAVNINKGEISSPNDTAISLISANNLQLKIKLAEIDLVKVKVGDKARVTLDTYGDAVNFDGVVSQVDPAATVNGGASTYYAKINFVNKDERIKSGMNGSAKIITFQKENANYVDAKYLLINGSSTTVKVISGKNLEDKNVEIGIRTSGGQVEILSGIAKEDRLSLISDAEILAASTTEK